MTTWYKCHISTSDGRSQKGDFTPRSTTTTNKNRQYFKDMCPFNTCNTKNVVWHIFNRTNGTC